MNREEYKEKLKQFNSTHKYKCEVNLLVNLMNPRAGEKILDYGCGLGRTVRHINEVTTANCFGYDVRNLREQDDQYFFRDSFHFKFHKVFFMHSLAHIPSIKTKLDQLKEFLYPDSRVYVVTPNRLWIREVNGREYIPDPTVIEHFSSNSLGELFYHCGYEVVNAGQFGDILNNQHERLFIEVKLPE